MMTLPMAMANLAVDILPGRMEEVGEEPVDALEVDVPADHHKLTLAWGLIVIMMIRVTIMRMMITISKFMIPQIDTGLVPDKTNIQDFIEIV